MFKLNVKRKFFTDWVGRCWNRLPREPVDAPSLEAFRTRLDEALGNLEVGGPACGRGVGTQ